MELTTIVRGFTNQEVLLAVLTIILFTILLWCCCKRNSEPKDSIEETGRKKGKMAVDYEEENGEN